MRSLLMQRFAIERWGLVYWEAGKDKMVSEYGFSEILLDND